jgi:hypothetical protein
MAFVIAVGGAAESSNHQATLIARRVFFSMA